MMESEVKTTDVEIIPLRLSDSTSASYDNEEEELVLAKEFVSRLKIKDSGYAWVVASSLLVGNVLTAGYIKSFGMTYNTLLSAYPKASTTLAGLMMSLLSGCRSTFAPVAGAISNRYGFRITMIFGTSICFSGLLGSLFCTSIIELSITLGAMMGVGICMIESSQVVVVAEYFETKLSIANGFRATGNPLGGMLYPFLIVHLLETYGVTQLRLVLAGVILNVLVCAAITRPIATHQKIQILSAIRKESISSEEKKKLLQISQSLLPEHKRKRKMHLHFQRLLDPVYLLFIAMAMLISIALPTVVYYLPIYGQSVGLSPYENSILLSFFSITDISVRLIIGFVSDKTIFKKWSIFIFTLLSGGVGALFIPLFSTLWGLLAVSMIFAIGSAGYFVLINVVLTEQFGKKEIATTWGFVRMTQGIFNFISPPLIGYIIDVTGGFTVPFQVMGCGMILAGFILMIEPIIIKITKSQVIIS